MKKIVIASLFTLSALCAEQVPDIITQNGCMECHQVRGQKTAPAYKGISQKNRKFFAQDAKAQIIKGIKEGSQGKYKNFQEIMPPYAHFSDEELSSMADWILSIR